MHGSLHSADMKHILLPEQNEQIHYYRANLHCHSVVSDG